MYKILIVEDDAGMRNIYRDFFHGKVEYSAEIVDNGVTGYKRLKDEKFDLIILDMIMEKLAGDSVFAIVRDDSRNTGTPVIVVSVLDKSDDAIFFILEDGNAEYLQKPITEEALMDKIEEVIKRER